MSAASSRIFWPKAIEIQLSILPDFRKVRRRIQCVIAVSIVANRVSIKQDNTNRHVKTTAAKHGHNSRKRSDALQ